LCEETITPEQTQRLEELVLSDPAAEAYYVQFMSFYADLVGRFRTPPDRAVRAAREQVGELLPVSVPPGPVPGARPGKRSGRGVHRSRLAFWSTVSLAGLAAALLITVGLWPPNKSTVQLTPPPAPEQVDDTVAVLLQTHKAEWEDTGLPTRP